MSSVVSLPSIHEGFPDVDFKDAPLTRSYQSVGALLREVVVTGTSPHVPCASPRHLNPSITAHLQPSHQGPPSRKGNWHSTRSGVPSGRLQNEPAFFLPQSHRQSMSQTGHLVSSASASPMLPSFSLPCVDPSASECANIGRKSSFIGTHSFDVLRSDPTTFSLEHIASSKTLQSRGPNTTKPATPTGIANGSAPAFRVVLPTMTSNSMCMETPLDTMDGRSSPGAAGSIDARHIHSIVDVGSSQPTSVFSFSDGTHVTKMAIDDEIRSRFLEVGDRGATFRVEGRGKKHQCPQCPKRFNRPSSLRIHVNTHTGARPFQCPYPNCGREFNVNSNMRRHYRNHSTAATAEVHPPRHNSGRRPRGYLRPHPGHLSTTIFHISAGQSPRTTLSAASFTDDDFDMEQISDDGEGSAFDDDDDDDDDADEGDEEETRTTHYRSSSWSLTPITPPEHPRVHSSRYSLSDTHMPSAFLTRYSELSQSVSQHLGHIVCSPSSPAYVQPCKDTKVSTTLRPAFR